MNWGTYGFSHLGGQGNPLVQAIEEGHRWAALVGASEAA